MTGLDILYTIFAQAQSDRANAIAAIPMHFNIAAGPYNDICIAISELPDEEQGAWDAFVIDAIYEGWTYSIINE